ncbi:MAG: glycosyltransferase family 1 protein [Chloroflexota bacterium]
MVGKDGLPPLVGINAHLLAEEAGYRRAGIHQYMAQVLRHLPENGRFAIFTRHPLDFLPDGQFKRLPTGWPTGRRLVRILWEQTAWPWQAWRERVNLLHAMAFVTPMLSPCPTVVTVFDLSFIHTPDSFPRLQRLYLHSQTARSCRQARRVITISESGRQDVAHYFGVPLERIDVVLPGVEPIYRPLPAADVAAFRQREGLPEQFLLHVGTLQPRKNIPVLLEALAQINRPDLPLVLVGGKGWLFDEIFARVQALGLQNRVRFTGYVPDEVLPLWYNAATLLLFPSLYEGFGLPILEAMACKTAVIAANTSSIPEAVGNAGLLFDPHNPAQLAEQILSVLDDPAQLATMQQRGLAHAQLFSWERAGRETAVVYQRALGTRIK